jgi:hypothetical protein
MNWFLPDQSPRARGPSRAAPARRAVEQRRRLPRFEPLESRSLLAVLPFGAMPDDTGEYMLGDVLVTVVLMESDPTLSPRDNNPAPQGIGAPAENWATNTVNTIAAVKQKVQAGLDWWENTLDNVLVGTPAEGRDLLDFTIDWTYADNPVHTGYEPIARTSNDFVLWMYDFLNLVGFNQTGNFSTDIRAYNNFKRDGATKDYDWSFTIFVVNDEVDADDAFQLGGQFTRAFSFAGGRMMIVPASRPESTFAHEAAHAFWALDEYSGTTANYLTRRGYYNTPNSNHASNPDPDFVQQDSIMANDPARQNSWLANVLSTSSKEMIGWLDSDGDGVFDVLDVPFLLEGIGRYDSSLGEYLFTGFTQVDTLPNQNSSGLQNDITINQIREVQYSLDDGPWTTIETLPARTFKTGIEIGIPVAAGDHTIKIRTIDTRTSAMSPEFIGTTEAPTQTTSPGAISGFVWQDDNGNAVWDGDEQPLPDWALVLVDEDGNEVNLVRRIEPSLHQELALLNSVHSEALLSAVGSEVANSEVRARTTTRANAGKVFANNSIVLGNNIDTWNASRQLRIDFPNPVSSLSLKAYAAGISASFARLEIYNSSGQLLDRFTSGALSSAGTTLSLRRGEGDIAYAIARGHAGTEVVLDTLQWGPAASATSNALGSYSLAGLPAGVYRVRLDLPPQHVLTTHPSNVVELTLAAGQGIGGVNFGIDLQENQWHNLANAFNVSGDVNGDISPIDALMVINWLNSHTVAELPDVATPEIHGYVDVNNDGYCTPIDALLVINYLNTPPASPPAPPGEGEALWQAPADNSAAEGEEVRLAAPQNAAEYYARNPIHFQFITGADLPCGCEQCAAAVSSSSSPAAKSLPVFRPQISLSVVDTTAFASSIQELREDLRGVLDDRLDHLLQSMEGDPLPPLFNPTHELKEAVALAVEDLDELLERIVPEVAGAWQIALERALRRLPHGLG